MPVRRERHSNPRFIGLVMTYFLLQVVLLNVYKNEITSAFSQVESSAEIKAMVEPQGGNELKNTEGDSFVTRSFYARGVELVRTDFHRVLQMRKPYCDVNVHSLLIHFSMPYATYSEMPVFCNILKIGGKTPSPWTETLHTLQKFGLVNLKTPYHLHGVDAANLDERAMSLVAFADTEMRRVYNTWTPHGEILREVYHAAFELKEGTCLNYDQVVPLLKALTAMWALSFFCWLTEWKLLSHSASMVYSNSSIQ